MPPSRSRSPPPMEMEFLPFKRWVPWFVPTTVAANVLMFCITMYVNDCPKKNGKNCVAKFLGRFSFQPLTENPILGPSAATLAKMGALDVTDVIDKHELWRLIASIWLHAGVGHLLANMLSLLFIGINLEREFGFVRIGTVYLISGLGGNILSALFVQNSISVGASGALFGLLGAMLSELITNWTIYANKLAAMLTLIVIVVLNMAVGLIPHVDNFAHIGGFISGFLLGFMLLIRPQFGYINQKYSLSPVTIAKPKFKPYQYVLLVSSALLLVSGFVTVMVLLLRGVNGNDHCRWCKYLSCIPTAKWSCTSSQPYCEASVFDNRYNLTCVNNGRSSFFPVTEENSSQLEQLCSQLCS